jgi:hypothetical protein
MAYTTLGSLLLWASVSLAIKLANNIHSEALVSIKLIDRHNMLTTVWGIWRD